MSKGVKGVLHAVTGHKPGHVKAEYAGDWKPGNWHHKTIKATKTGPSNRFVQPQVDTEHTYLRHGQKARKYSYRYQDRKLRPGTKAAITAGTTAAIPVAAVGGTAAIATHHENRNRRVKKSLSAFGVDHG